jgi:hypothetical protein
MSVRPVTDLTQDVRFAVAMAGGVSLAVWMGGVSREVNLLQQASDSRPREDDATDLSAPPDGNSGPSWDARARALYRNLLELLDVTITVDVLSGTSAGGINAALLGMSSAGGADLAGLSPARHQYLLNSRFRFVSCVRSPLTKRHHREEQGLG